LIISAKRLVANDQRLASLFRLWDYKLSLATMKKCKLVIIVAPNKLHKAFAGSTQTGFSLLEVLISIIVLSFGLLGMVGLQAAALQGNREARLQSTAVSLARELAEMMRGNKAVGLNAAAANPYVGKFTSPLKPTTASYCLNVAVDTVACANATEKANAEMTEWLARVESELPGARVITCIDSAPFDAKGLPQWDCTPAGTNASMVIKIGWTRGSTDRSSKNKDLLDSATLPSVTLPVIPGSSV
jgi:type IV pilus assembly protein PilV